MNNPSYISLPPDREPKILGLFTGDKSFYRSFFPLLAVIAMQQLAAIAVNMADNIMLGRYSELALSGATLVNQIQFILQQIAAGTGMGIVVLAGRYWGRQEIGPIKKIISLGVKFGLLVGALFFAMCKIMPETLLSLFTNEEEVIAEGVRYLELICWTYPVFALSNSLMYSLQSVETAAIGTVMSISTLCINMVLNFLLIYGNFGFPEMGIVGAAAATLISRIVELFIILIYVLRIDKKLKMRFSELLRLDFSYLVDFVKIASPICLSGLMWGVAQATQTAILGHISAATIAANSIASVIYQVFAVVSMASANTASVVIAKTIGQGRLDKVKAYAKTIQGIFLLIGIVFSGAMFLLRDAIVGFYSVSEETRRLALSFLVVLTVGGMGGAYQYPVAGGIVAGGGSTKYVALVDNLFMWLFTIPSAYLSAFVFEFSPLVTFCFLKADQVLKCIPNGIVCNRWRWVKPIKGEKE